MAEMIDRVARAMCEEKLWLGAFDQETPGNQDAWRSQARAAILAMRLPTEPMYRAFETQKDTIAPFFHGYQAAIDEALGDKNG